MAINKAENERIVIILNEKIRVCRKEKGLSQQELADRLHVVRQTVSKWEKGLSVPDCDMLIALSQVLEVPVGMLLEPGADKAETGGLPKDEDVLLEELSRKLESINWQLAQNKEKKRRWCRRLLAGLAAAVIAGFVFLLFYQSAYLKWDLSDPETAVFASLAHILEWIFVRVAPFLLLAAGLGWFCLYKNKNASC